MSRADDSDDLDEELIDLAEELDYRDRVDIEEREQTVGTLRKMFDADELDKLPDDEILDTSGLLSHVRDDEETIGHVLMIEWDEIEDVMRPIRTADRLPGISILLRSSPGSYHLFNLSVRDRDEQLLDAVRKNGDVWQARWAARRGYFVLRILPKLRSQSREVYKDAPEPVRVFTRDSEFPQSRPHLDMLIDIAEEQSLRDIADDLLDARESFDLVGDGLKVDHYQTVTDEAKEVLE